MSKNTIIAVRSHEQEREWLRTLGKGSIFDGVKNLIQRDRDGYAGRKNYASEKGRRSK